MAEIRRLSPHDPIPGDHEPHVLVMKRFGEDDPRAILVEIVVQHGPGVGHGGVALDDAGTPLGFDAAVREAARRADAEKIPVVYALDRTSGPREQEILRRAGNHSVGTASLDDDDLEEGEPGPDMRGGH